MIVNCDGLSLWAVSRNHSCWQRRGSGGGVVGGGNSVKCWRKHSQHSAGTQWPRDGGGGGGEGGFNHSSNNRPRHPLAPPSSPSIAAHPPPHCPRPHHPPTPSLILTRPHPPSPRREEKRFGGKLYPTFPHNLSLRLASETELERACICIQRRDNAGCLHVHMEALLVASETERVRERENVHGLNWPDGFWQELARLSCHTDTVASVVWLSPGTTH